MALVLPDKVRPARDGRQLHPAIGLLAGFGLMALAATAAHLLFGLL